MNHQLALGLKEAADTVGLSHWTLRQYIKQGKLTPIRLGRRVLIEPKELERLIEQGRGGKSERSSLILKGDIIKMANNSVLQEKTQFMGDGELVTEIRKRLIKTNDYIQHPSEKYFVDLMDQDLIQVYGRERIEEVVHNAFANYCDARPNSYGVPYMSSKMTALFGEFNKDYFDGKLPPYKVHVRYHLLNLFQTAEIWREQQVIQILAASEAYMVMRLLAEMARVASLDDNYGDRWEAEMNRLFRAGAPMGICANTLPPGVNAQELTAEDFIKAASRPHYRLVPRP